MALKALALDSCNVIGIGDSPFDYQAAQCCNIDSALVATGGDSKDFLIEKCRNAIGIFDNLKCLAKKVFDLEIPPEDIASKLPKGFAIQESQLYAFGVCEECNKAKL